MRILVKGLNKTFCFNKLIFSWWLSCWISLEIRISILNFKIKVSNVLPFLFLEHQNLKGNEFLVLLIYIQIKHRFMFCLFRYKGVSCPAYIQIKHSFMSCLYRYKGVSCPAYIDKTQFHVLLIQIQGSFFSCLYTDKTQFHVLLIQIQGSFLSCLYR